MTKGVTFTKEDIIKIVADYTINNKLVTTTELHIVWKIDNNNCVTLTIKDCEY